MKDVPLWSRVSRRMWRSTDFRALGRIPPSAPSLWAYLLTGEHCKAVPGLFVLGFGTMADDLRWTDKEVRKYLKALSDKGHVRMDEETNVVWIERALDHNWPENPNVVVGWRRDWQGIPQCSLKIEAQVSLRSRLATLPPKVQKNAAGEVVPPPSLTPYADNFDVVTGDRPPNPSANPTGKPKGNPPTDVTPKDVGNVRLEVSPNVDQTMGLTEREREREKERPQPREGAHAQAPARKAQPIETDPVVAEYQAPELDPESTDPTDLLNAMADGANGNFDRWTGSGTDVEVQFQRRLFEFGVNVGFVRVMSSLMAKGPTVLFPTCRLKAKENFRMSWLMGAPTESGVRAGSWLGALVAKAEAVIAANAVVVAKEAAASAAPKTLVTGDDVTRLKPSFLRVVSPSSGSSDVG